MTNEFRNNQPPKTTNSVIPEERKHDFKPQTLRPPVFEEDLRENKTVGIALMYSIFHTSSKMFR